MNLLEKIDQLRAKNVTPERFMEKNGVSLEDYLDGLMEFIQEQKASKK